MHKITLIEASGSELQMIDGMKFQTAEQADMAIFALVDAFNMGHAKTKLTVTWEDGESITWDCDFSLRCQDGLVAYMAYSVSNGKDNYEAHSGWWDVEKREKMGKEAREFWANHEN